MNTEKAYAVYFSPTGTTERAVTACAEGTGLPYEKIDLTLPKTRQKSDYSFAKTGLVIAGLPVYGGRLPKHLDDFFSGLKGDGTPAAALVMYGNREYEDALIELKIRLEGRGFNVIAGAAFIGEHTFSNKIATGRPDAGDLEIARDFGKKALEAVEKATPGKLTVKGNYPYVVGGFDPTQPRFLTAAATINTSEDCTRCGLCAENCPWGAIDGDDYAKIDTLKCLRCFRCIKYCPAEAKKVTDPMFYERLREFEKRLNAVRKEPEIFLPG
jgi:ferredoxin